MAKLIANDLSAGVQASVILRRESFEQNAVVSEEKWEIEPAMGASGFIFIRPCFFCEVPQDARGIKDVGYG